MQAPSESLAEFASKIQSVHQELEDSTTVYTGELTPKAAQALAQRKEPSSAPTGGEGEVTCSGNYTITVRDGDVVEVAFQIQRSGTVDGKKVERAIHRKFAIQQIGDVPHEVPTAVRELLQ